MRINKFYITIILFIVKSTFFFAQVNSNEVTVKSYVKDNGTIIHSHQRTAPNSTNSDNFSTKGNINPYTGKLGWINSDNGKPITLYTNYNYEVDSSRLNYERNYDYSDNSINKKLEEAILKEALEKMTNKRNPNFSFDEEDFNLDGNLDEENIIINSIAEIQNNDLPTKGKNELQSNKSTNSKGSKTLVENKKESKPNSHKYIFPIVVILSFIIIFIKESIK